MPSKALVFDETRGDYIRQIAETDPDSFVEPLGFVAQGSERVVTLIGTPYRLLADDIVDAQGQPATFDVCVILSSYILMCQAAPSRKTDWAAFRDFPDAGPLLKFFADNVEGRVAGAFSGRPGALVAAANALGGEPVTETLAYDVKYRFQALPQVGMLLLFNDADEEFPTQCRVLFEHRVESYLDMESVAILGSYLAGRLVNLSTTG